MATTTPPKAPPKPAATLADLSDAARAQLRAELRAEDVATAQAAVGASHTAAAATMKAFAALMDDRDHLRHCPATNGAGRFEWYPHLKPAQPDRAVPAQPVTVVRCIECGGSAVIGEPLTEVVKRISRSLTTTPTP